MPRITLRVVCGRSLVIATFVPTSAFVRVDLPTFGRPTRQANPDLKPGSADAEAAGPPGAPVCLARPAFFSVTRGGLIIQLSRIPATATVICMAETPVWRPTARLFVLDPDNRVLLFSSGDPTGRTWWFTPGGGVHRGETVASAAVRELAEETGFAYTEDELGPVVATSMTRWPRDDGRMFLSAHTFFLVRVPHPELNTDGQEEFERSYITGHRWWALDELRAATDEIYPPDIADTIDALLRSDVIDRPLRLPLGLGDQRGAQGAVGSGVEHRGVGA
jgi:8-oxo-dGTP pyrophosphatase MutT (NUDIX family)